MNIPFNIVSVTDKEIEYATDAMRNNYTSGDGKYTFRVYEKFKEKLGIEHMLLTTSGTTALEMAAILSEIQPGDEIIVPSFTFSSTANAFMLRGGRPVFCDIRPDTLNIDETKIESLITKRTKAIYAVDYAGVPCEMDTINKIAKEHDLLVIEDAAQAVGSYYHGRPAGCLGDFGCYSFHETKNYSMGEGGAIIIMDTKYMDRAEIIREKGTNRRQVLNGLTDKYTWHDIGSSFLPSDILAGMLYGQLERFDEIMSKRTHIWNMYHKGFESLEADGLLKRPAVPEGITHNGHAYNIILPTAEKRTALVDALRDKGVHAYICYVPLHSAPYGLELGYNPESCPITEDYGQRALRLPLYTDLTEAETHYVIGSISDILRA